MPRQTLTARQRAPDGLGATLTANGVEPTAYLTDVLPKIRDATTDDALDALLPDRWRPTSAD